MHYMRKVFFYTGMILSLLLPALLGAAQSVPAGLSADITADRQAILIGEPLRLTLTIRSSPGNLVFPIVPDSLPHFEILSRSKVDTVTDKDLVQMQQVITVTSFDSGHWSIPAFNLPGSNVVTDSVGVDVGFLPMKADDPLRDIKGIIAVSAVIPWWMYAASAAVLVLLVILLVRTLRKKKVLTEAESLSSDPPYEEAIKSLEGLREPVASADIKPYYTRLDGILKRYLLRAYGWNSLQFTTTEMLAHLQVVITEPGESLALAEALRLEDAVKYARFFPGSDDHIRALAQVRKALDLLHKNEKTS